MAFTKKLSIILLGLTLAAGCGILSKYSSAPLVYPETHKADVKDTYHGTVVADPYRWLEDPDAPDTRVWIEAENALTFSWLEEIPERETIRKRLTKLWNYEKYGMPFKKGGRYFFSRNDGLQNQSVYYWSDALEGKPRLLIDPNTFSEDGTIALAGMSVSEDGKWLAYGLASGGSDWTEWHVREVDTGRDQGDHLKWIKFSGASWDRQGKGFYYSRFDEPEEGRTLQEANYYQKLYYHAVGTPQSEDRLVYERPDHKDWNINGSVTDDRRFLIIHIGKGTDRKNLLFYKDLADPEAPVVELIDTFEAQYGFIDNDGPILWLFTDLDAPRSKVIAVDTRSPDKASWHTVIPQAGEILSGVSLVNNTFIASYLKDAHTQVKLFDIEGRFIRELELPGLGTAYGFGGKRNEKETFYGYTGFSDPRTIYRLELDTGMCEIYRRPKVDFDPKDYTTRQVFYGSKDGTKVPMFITHKKGLKLNGNNPTLLNGYGGFNSPVTPFFSLTNLLWMEMGGVFAIAGIRGGGEYGKTWHEAGMILKKQNCFDDFIAAAEWLIREGYTSTPKLAIKGASNGGLLVGACMTQRPDLFGACLPAVGVMDMLRFNRFTIGWAWVSDYGSPDNPEEFKALHAYSPLHNIKDGVAYPATLVTTADHDDRVVPAHSFKFTARLQEAQGGSAPTLIRIETRAGHGGGKPTAKRIEEAADIYAFLTRVLKM